MLLMRYEFGADFVYLGWTMDNRAGVWAAWLLLGPHDQEFGLKARIWALGFEFGFWSWSLGFAAGGVCGRRRRGKCIECDLASRPQRTS